MIIFHSFLLRMRNVSDTSCRESRYTRILCSINFCFEKYAFCEIMWKNMVEPGQAADDSVIRRMRFACWVIKATDRHTHTEYVVLIGFPLQQWFSKHASILRLEYVASLIGF